MNITQIIEIMAQEVSNERISTNLSLVVSMLKQGNVTEAKSMAWQFLSENEDRYSREDPENYSEIRLTGAIYSMAHNIIDKGYGRK